MRQIVDEFDLIGPLLDAICGVNPWRIVGCGSMTISCQSLFLTKTFITH